MAGNMMPSRLAPDKKGRRPPNAAMAATLDSLSRPRSGGVIMWDALWRNGKVATMTTSAPCGLMERGAIAVEDGRIVWVGEESLLEGSPGARARHVHDLGGRVLTPGLVDCHNHAVYHGDALSDFELLTQGGTRADMIADGGGVPGLRRRRAPPTS